VNDVTGLIRRLLLQDEPAPEHTDAQTPYTSAAFSHQINQSINQSARQSGNRKTTTYTKWPAVYKLTD